jgi:pimeloyl-ACP methyl ester carboxylesterase
VLDQVEGKLDLTYRELGRQNLKNIAKPIEVYAVQIDAAAAPGARFLAAANLRQEIRYCRAPDGVRLAYATAGTGPPLLRSAHWLGHLEYDWELPLHRQFLLGLATDHALIRYDARGNGLSDWDVHEVSLDAWVSDMETVADAAGLGRFPLVGFSQGCAVSIAYAARHPERVSHLILFGGFSLGSNARPDLTMADRERFAAVKTLVRQGWGVGLPTPLWRFADGSSVNKIANVENVVCSVETMARHPEVYHYTKPGAFEGIISSQTLWCSHYREMICDEHKIADKNEIELAREPLIAAIAPLMDAIIENNENQKFNRTMRRSWRKLGGGSRTARDLVNSLYGATYDGKAVYSSLDPYLFSFSTHADDTAYEREHGVRSQWDRYTGGDGFCLVFDLREVAEMLKQEGQARYWAWLTLDPVRYTDTPIENLFPDMVSGLADILRQVILGVKTPEAATKEFLRGTTLLKDANYTSEREVRIVAIPGTRSLAHTAKEFPREFDATQPLPEIGTRPEPHSDKHYIALFSGLNLRLPIRRVIVGPGARQKERAERARLMVANIPVTVSRCP